MSTAGLLSILTFVTNLGDYLSLFATMYLVHQKTGSVLFAAYSVPMQSIAIALSGICYPMVISYFSYRSIFTFSQMVSAALVVLVAFGWEALSPYILLLIIFLLAFFKQVFETARDAAGKPAQEADNHRATWVTIYLGRYGAQVLGPPLAFFLIMKTSILMPYLLDAISFGVCGWLSRRLPENTPQAHSILKPAFYIWKKPALWRLVLIRSVGFWVPAGIFNYLVFSVVRQSFQRDPLDTVWVYLSTGVGSVLAVLALRDADLGDIPILRRIREYFKGVRDARLAAAGLFGLAVSRSFFFKLPSFSWALLILGTSGFFMTLNAMGAQSLRSKITTQEQFSEVSGFEVALGKTSEFLAASLAGLLIAAFPGGFQNWLWISVAGYALLGLLMQSRELRI